MLFGRFSWPIRAGALKRRAADADRTCMEYDLRCAF